MTRTPAVAIMAKAPVEGTVKTRLAGELGPERCVELYRAFLLDKIDQVTAIPGVTPYLAYAGADDPMQKLTGDRIRLLRQRGSNLGARLSNVADDLAPAHHGVLLVDSDTPNLPSDALVEARNALDTDDVVIGPAWDGGYYLIGMRRPDQEIFADVDWSTSRVLAQTVRNARRRGLSAHLLAAWYDVDTPYDLRRLAVDLAATPTVRPGYPHRTAELVQGLVSGSPEVARNEQWRTLATRRAYANPWTRLDEAIVELPNGHLTLYGVVTCPQCVGIVPHVSGGQVLLVRQFRYVAQRETWEIPTGGAAEGEDLEEAAQRELAEECGYRAGRLVHLSTFHTSKSVMDEVAHIYAAYDLRACDAQRDATESIDVRAFRLDDALDMVRSGEIVDSMSVVGLLLAARLDALEPAP